MKHRVYTRGLSLIIAMIMVVAMFPVSVFAQTKASAPVTETGTIVVEKVNQKRGDTFDVDISLRDNPGVMSMRFALVYDDTVLTLTNVEYNEAIADDAEKPDDYSTVKSPFTLYWENSNDVNYEADGVFATVTFHVAEDAPIGKSCELSVIYDPEEIYDVNENNVSFEVISGKCLVVDCRPGDINGDGKANSKDVTRLRRYYAQSSGGNSVEVNLSAMDVNGDGKTNSKDVTRLRRYYAGQDVEIHCACTMIRCSHTLSAVAATAASCTEVGNSAYWHCTDCGKYFSDENATVEIDLADTVIPTVGHTVQAVSAKEATCTEVGNTAYWECSVCGTLFSDADGKNTIAKIPTVAATGHTFYLEEWVRDANYHWHAAICGHDAVADKGEHVYVNNKCVHCKFVKDARVKLSTPLNVYVEKDEIHWSSVTDDDIIYVVRVNGDYYGTTSQNFIMISDLRNTSGSAIAVNKADPSAVTLTVCVMAQGNDTTYLDSDWSEPCSGYQYVPDSDSSQTEELKSYRLGYAYNLVEDEYLNISKSSQDKVLNGAKLLTLAEYSVTRNAEGGYSEYYTYSSVDEYIAQREGSFNAKVGVEIPVVGGLNAQLSYSNGSNYRNYSYNQMFVVEAGVTANDHKLLNLSSEDLVACLDFGFLADVNGETTDNLSNEALAAYIYEKYGTHVILGVTTGASYLAQYSVSTNDESIASSVKSSFEAGVKTNFAKVVSLDIGVSGGIMEDETRKSTDTEALLSVTWSGSYEGAVTDPSGLDDALRAWGAGIDPVSVRFTDGGAVSISSLIRVVDPALADAFDALVAEKTDEAYDALYAQYDKQLTRLINAPASENGQNVLTIDLSSYQKSASLDNAYDPNFLDGVLSVYPKMYGKYIDKIVIKGAFDAHKTLIETFTLKLEGNWNRDVEIVIDNLGVLCTSACGIVDTSALANAGIVTVSYNGVSIIKDTVGTLHCHAKTPATEFHGRFILADDEKIDISTARRDGEDVYLPIVSIVGYDFVGWKDGAGVLVTDGSGKLNAAYVSLVAETPLSVERENAAYTLILNNNGADKADGTAEIKQVYGKRFTDANGETLKDGTVDKSIDIPKKIGHIFEGYFTKDGTPVIDADGKIVASSTTFNSERTVELVARWDAAVYQINLNNNGADMTAGTAVYYQKYGVGLYADADCTEEITHITTPEKTAYSFAGYSLNGTQCIDPSGEIKATNTTFNEATVSADPTGKTDGIVTFTAQWSQHIVITLDTLKANNAEATDFVYMKKGEGTVYSDENCTKAITKITKPTRTGYTFVGYYLNGVQYIDKDGNIRANITSLTGDTLVPEWSVNSYTVSWSEADHVTIVVKRTDSPEKGAEPGQLSSGDKIYYGDVLSITYTAAANYQIEESKKGISEINCVTGNVTASDIYATAQGKPQSVTFNLNTSSTDVSPKCYSTPSLNGASSTKQVNYGSTYGTLPTPTADYYAFDGWYTSATGGTKVTASTISALTTSQTLYAHWTKTKPGYTYVKTATDLSNIRNNTAGKYFLIDNITVGNWTPIPTFSGELDGNGKCIKNLKASKPLSTPSYFGFFEAITNATVSNITFENVSIAVTYTDNNNSARIFVGTLAGRAENSKITNVSVEGSVTLNDNTTGSLGGEARVAGIIGQANGCQFVNCSNSARIYNRIGASNTGGIVGESKGDTFTKCTNTGGIFGDAAVVAGKAFVGGIVGVCKGNSIFSQCVNSGSLGYSLSFAAEGKKGDIYGKLSS